jgi:hypothetical protein
MQGGFRRFFQVASKTHILTAPFPIEKFYFAYEGAKIDILSVA